MNATTAPAPVELYTVLPVEIRPERFTLARYMAGRGSHIIWDVTNGTTLSIWPTRDEAADQALADFSEVSGIWPDEDERTEEGHIVYSMDDGSAVVVRSDGTIRHYEART